jgi:hypothetical protein
MIRAHTIVVDIGSGYTKSIYLPANTAIDRLKESVSAFRTAVGPARASTIQPGVKQLEIEFEDKCYFVGQTAENALDPSQRTNTLSENWAYEDGHKALLYYVLARTLSREGVEPSETPIPIRLVTGLPQAYYEAGAEKINNLLQGVHRFRHAGNTWVLNLVDVQVVPQAMGAYYTATEALLTEDEAQERVGIIDIGTYTTDFCLSENVQYHSYESGGTPVGVSTLVKHLKEVLERDLGVGYSDDSVRKAFDRHTVLVRGESTNVSKQINEVTNQVGRALVRDFPSQWDTSAMLLVLAGGGAEKHFFGNFFRREYPHIKIIDAPANAIVLGYAIYGAALDAE